MEAVETSPLNAALAGANGALVSAWYPTNDESWVIRNGSQTDIENAALKWDADLKAHIAKVEAIKKFYAELNSACYSLTQTYKGADYGAVCADLKRRGFISHGVAYTNPAYNSENMGAGYGEFIPYELFFHPKYSFVSFTVYVTCTVEYHVNQPDENFDTVFQATGLIVGVLSGPMMGAAALAAGGVAPYILGAYNAANGAADGNDFTDSFAVSALKTWANAPSESATMNDLDYAAAFDPVDYSSGEGFAITTDASNVDFGFGTVEYGAPGGDWSANSLTDPLAPVATYSVQVGATPENFTSNFGAVDYPFGRVSDPGFTMTDAKSALQVTQLALGVASQVTNMSGGGAKYSVQPVGQVTNSPSVGGSLAAQLETARRVVGTAQLAGGNQGAPYTPVNTGFPWAIFGLVGLGAYFIMRKG
jgi:hypothetical protein